MCYHIFCWAELTQPRHKPAAAAERARRWCAPCCPEARNCRKMAASPRHWRACRERHSALISTPCAYFSAVLGPGNPVPPSGSTTAQQGPVWLLWHLPLGQEGTCTELKKALKPFRFKAFFLQIYCVMLCFLTGNVFSFFNLLFPTELLSDLQHRQ